MIIPSQDYDILYLKLKTTPVFFPLIIWKNTIIIGFPEVVLHLVQPISDQLLETGVEEVNKFIFHLKK